MILLATLYFNFILPYYQIKLFDKPYKNLVKKNFINNITNLDADNNFINISYLDEDFIVFDKINYTNKNVYIQF